MKKIFRTLLYIAYVCIFLAAIGVVLSVFSVGGLKMFVVMSGSMEPAIHTGSIVVTRPASDYAVGDVITFVSGTALPTTHRIVEERVDAGEIVYKTKGDANNSNDTQEVSARAVIGKVAFSVPYVGYAVESAKRPFGLFLLIIIPALLIVINEVREIIIEIGRMRKRIKEHDQNNPERL